MAQVSPSPVSRPGLVTFAAIMMFVLGGFQAVIAISEFINGALILGNTYGWFGGQLWVWGLIDIVLAAVALYAGYDLLRGGEVGRILGIIIASVNAIRWFLYIPYAPQPILGVIMLVADFLIIYGLAASGVFFRSSSERMM